ncbi:hypothetical protein RHSIM_Rhsim06G0082600 [Rhododendron simsii]|uniref:Uncharacterized protein n=1 Tax=Rhododendron simsii TaxID=118357 RepID=A0A834GUZ3_RHOSS|nr:hypothetical protein RHSIM_Rhsim06G0082600 [Rhododendron simsii]
MNRFHSVLLHHTSPRPAPRSVSEGLLGFLLEAEQVMVEVHVNSICIEFVVSEYFLYGPGLHIMPLSQVNNLAVSCLQRAIR